MCFSDSGDMTAMWQLRSQGAKVVNLALCLPCTWCLLDQASLPLLISLTQPVSICFSNTRAERVSDAFGRKDGTHTCMNLFFT